FSGKVKYLYQSNKGNAAALNAGIRMADSRYICFLDDDDLYTSNSLQSRISAIKQYNADIVIGKRKKVHRLDSKGIVNSHFLKRYKKSIIEKKEALYLCDSSVFFKQAIEKGFFVDTNSILLKKEFLENIGFYDEELVLSLDIDLYFRAFFAAKRFVYVDDILSVCRYYLQRHARNINKLFLYERKRSIKHIRILNEKTYDKKLIRILKRRLCAKKYKIKGILEYREGNHRKALRHFARSLNIYRDRETLILLCKALIPKIVTYRLKYIRTALTGAK
ncbi:MAG: glycosyltransferase, partial [Candidatus Omnitrophica bacterium]|nr:glycosyltransferase [Candidatus Omnitrophota bacterium]